jgi:hypothetical protein
MIAGHQLISWVIAIAILVALSHVVDLLIELAKRMRERMRTDPADPGSEHE